MERQDFGVPPIAQLHNGPAHGPTPTSIPGGQVITTQELAAMMGGPEQPVLVDVLGGGPHATISGAIDEPSGGQGGSFNDANQSRLIAALRQATGGDTSKPVVFFCLGRECWLSYNAALRAMRAGYSRAMWYRGGLEAWQAAGLPTASSGGGQAFGGGGMMPGQPGQQMPYGAAGGPSPGGPQGFGAPPGQGFGAPMGGMPPGYGTPNPRR